MTAVNTMWITGYWRRWSWARQDNDGTATTSCCFQREQLFHIENGNAFRKRHQADRIRVYITALWYYGSAFYLQCNLHLLRCCAADKCCTWTVLCLSLGFFFVLLFVIKLHHNAIAKAGNLKFTVQTHTHTHTFQHRTSSVLHFYCIWSCCRVPRLLVPHQKII